MDFQRELFTSIQNGNTERACELLETNPEMEVSFVMDGSTCLHWACFLHNDRVVKALLAHPLIDVNFRPGDVVTPFYIACIHNSSCVSLLLDHPKTDTGAHETGGPFAYLMLNYDHENIEKWIVSGRTINLDDVRNMRELYKRDHNPLNKIKTAELLKDFTANPHRTRFRLQASLDGFPEPRAACCFAWMVLVCDNYFDVKETEASTNAGRFMTMACLLPMELQMVLARRTHGLMGDFILSKDRELAFQLAVEK